MEPGVPADPIRVAIDLETTGLRPEQDVIIEIGAVKFAGTRILDTFQSFVSIASSLPYRIHRLTGITNADLRHAPQLSALLAPLRAFIGPAPLVGHSVAFDASFLRRVGLAQRNPLLDTYELASMLLPDLPSYTLASVAETLQIPSSVHHRALADADLARAVFLALLERMQRLDTVTIEQLAALPVSPGWSPAHLIKLEIREREDRMASSSMALALAAAATPRRRGKGANALPHSTLTQSLDPSLPSMALYQDVRAEAEGALPAPPLASREEPPAPPLGRSERGEALATFMRDGGALLLEVERTETALLQTLADVARSVATTPGGQVIIAASDSEEMKRVARSLAPRALALAGLDVAQTPVAELDEREGYFSLRRWFGVAREELGQPLSAEVTRGLAKLTIWSRETRTGLRADVTLSGPESDAWARVRSGPEFAVAEADCPYRAGGYCFVERAERRAQGAALIVTTHAALAARLAGRDTLLPDVARVVILDGRQIEDELRRQRTFTLDGASALALLDTLANGTEPAAGLLALAATLAKQPKRAGEWRGAVERARQAILATCDALRTVQQTSQERNARAGSTRAESFDNGALRVDSVMRASEGWKSLTRAWEECCESFAMVAATAQKAADALAQEEGAMTPRACGARADLLGLARRIGSMTETGSEILSSARVADTVCWLRAPQAYQWSEPSRDRRNGQNGQNSATPSEGEQEAVAAETPSARDALLAEAPALVVAPTRVGEFLAPLWATGYGVAVVGWALSVGGEFEHTRGALGLPETTRMISSTPDYSRQTLLCLPIDAPEPAAQGYHAQFEALIVALARALEGDVVVIFPSHAALRTAATGIRRTLERYDILTLAQGMDGSARQLWQTFTSQPRTVLLGAGAFWDGAELRYRAPACVVVARTPFPPQSDPLVAARADVWADPQAQFMTPQAALKLRQALGGLAWSHPRRNAVVLYDRRLQTRSYGDTILGALPQCELYQAPAADLTERITDWTQE